MDEAAEEAGEVGEARWGEIARGIWLAVVRTLFKKAEDCIAIQRVGDGAFTNVVERVQQEC